MNLSWPRTQGIIPLSWIAGHIGGAVSDWDDGAGENWGRVLAGGRVVAFVWMNGPLAILESSVADAASMLRSRGIHVVTVPEMTSECLNVDRSILERFAARPLSEVFESTQFSAEDLVWATI